MSDDQVELTFQHVRALAQSMFLPLLSGVPKAVQEAWGTDHAHYLIRSVTAKPYCGISVEVCNTGFGVKLISPSGEVEFHPPGTSRGGILHMIRCPMGVVECGVRVTHTDGTSFLNTFAFRALKSGGYVVPVSTWLLPSKGDWFLGFQSDCSTSGGGVDEHRFVGPLMRNYDLISAVQKRRLFAI